MHRPVRRAGDRGFTLIELLIVIVVLGILAGIVLFGVARYRSDANAAACRADLATVNVAADAYDARTGDFPTDVAALVSGGYLKSTPAGTYAFDGTAKTVTRTPACDSADQPAPTPTTARTGAFTGLNGYCVDLANNSGNDGTAVQLATCNPTNAGQRWTAPAAYPGAIKALGSCLDVQGGGRANNTVVQLYGCNNTGAQVWTLQANGTLLNPQSGRCLSVNPGSPVRSQLFIFDCGTSGNQRWALA